jgi:hypothetical protein
MIIRASGNDERTGRQRAAPDVPSIGNGSFSVVLVLLRPNVVPGIAKRAFSPLPLKIGV